MHASGLGRSRAERVQQVRNGDPVIRDLASYVPIEDAAGKLRTWSEQGAEILYLSAHRKPEGVEQDRQVLRQNGFPDGSIFFRRSGEEYGDVAERILPDVLIEDDCESIGGEAEMTYPHLQSEAKARIKSIVVPEFDGIDDLPTNLSELAA